MKTKIIPINQNFVGRQAEQQRLETAKAANQASIIVVYGRRRVGKTELLEQFFRERNILKFEGIEGLPVKQQMDRVLYQLAEYTGNSVIRRLKPDHWTELFDLIADYVEQGCWTLYFEEVQWLANYTDSFITELKYVWDNRLRYNNQLIVILCGSSPSYIIRHVLNSKALYNRAEYELPIKEFSLKETKIFLKNRSLREIMDAYLTVGGIPEYLRWVNQDSSIFLGLCKNTFTTGGFFCHEYARVFTSSLSENKYYKKIIEYLSGRHHATRNEILRYLKIESGGELSTLLVDLEQCGFIQKYTPFNQKKTSTLVRYCVSDAYLQFYFKFVLPNLQDIEGGRYDADPTRAIASDAYQKWLGFAFERFCRKQHALIAKLLGFEAVSYQAGAFFNRATQKDTPGFQLDLVFDRADKVYTVCEIKYLNMPVPRSVITAFERKLALFQNPRGQTLHKVLITAEGAEKSLEHSGYFDRILTLKDLFAP